MFRLARLVGRLKALAVARPMPPQPPVLVGDEKVLNSRHHTNHRHILTLWKVNEF